MNAQQIKAVERAAYRIDSALKTLTRAREILNAAGAYEHDDMFLASSELTDAIAHTSSAFTATHMAGFSAKMA